MKKITMLCLSLLSSSALLADVRIMMDVMVGDASMKGEFVLDENNRVAELADPNVPNTVVQVQVVQPEEESTSTEVDLEVVVHNDGVMTSQMVRPEMGRPMEMSCGMVMMTIMVNRQ